MEFDSASTRVTLSSALSELILREIRENIFMRKLHYPVAIYQKIYFILIRGIRGTLEDKFA